MSHTRRDVLRLAAAVSVTSPLVMLGACDDDPGVQGDGLPLYEWSGEPGPESVFSHGVASGDPLPDRVILWTRVSTDEPGDVEVFYEVSAQPDFGFRLAAGTGITNAGRDHTFKVDPTRLPANTTLYYRFHCMGRTSPVGRTRTAPVEGVEKLRFVVLSCASMGLGYLHAYRFMSQLDNVDALLHLGDYIYEYGNDGGGAFGHSGYVPANECVTLEDYRTRYAYYHTFSELQAVHAAHPMICVWDDHEHANNCSKDVAQNHDESEGSWETRKLGSSQAWHEWLPVRPQADQLHIYRSFEYGDLARLVMLDTRLVGRDAQSGSREVMDDPERTMMGVEQEAWAASQLRESTATWNLIGQQIMLAPLLAMGRALNTDQWDGYPAARERLLSVIDEVENVAIFTGDIHSSWANDVPGEGYDKETQAGSRCVEFVTPAVSSRSMSFINENLTGILESSNPHIRFFEVTSRGFIVVDVDQNRTQGTWCLIPDIEPEEVPDPTIAARFEVRVGERHLRDLGIDGVVFDDLRAAEIYRATES